MDGFEDEIGNSILFEFSVLEGFKLRSRMTICGIFCLQHWGTVKGLLDLMKVSV